MTRPNILYIHSHDTGRYIQPYGHSVQTPRLQRLAEQGVLFRNAHCCAPTCSPSRAGLLTGTTPHRNGMVGLAHRGSQLKDYRWHLAHHLRDNGYETALTGVQHEIHGDLTPLGYEHFLKGKGDEDAVVNGCEFLRKKHDRPFFLSCGFFTTHRIGRGEQTFNVPAQLQGDSRYVRVPAPLPDLPQTRADFADYAVSANRLDAFMGQVFDALEESGQAQNTLVICTTDHGIAFPFMKCNLTDHGTGVMLIIRGPGGFTGGRVSDALVSHLDVFPTLCDVANLPRPDRLEGFSMLPLVRGQSDRIRDEVYAEVSYHAAAEALRSVRTERYRYVRRFDGRSRPVLPNIDGGLTKTVLVREGLPQRHLPAEQLFDLVFDPNEACNIAAQPDSAAVLNDMRARLDAWMRRTQDPLLTGRLDPWEGQTSNPVDADAPDPRPGPAEPIIVRPS